jgi:hypothetical protein
MTRTKKRGEWGQKVRGKSGARDKRNKPASAGSRNVMTMGEDANEGFHPGLAPEVSHGPDCDCPDHQHENRTLSIDEARALATRIFEKLQNKRK